MLATRSALALTLLAAGHAPPAERPAAPAPARNAVLIAIDSLRADHLELYGYPRATMPALTALLDRRGGTVYRRATAVSPSCHPSHTSMITGLYPQEVGVPWCGEEVIASWSDLQEPEDVAALERFQAELRSQPPPLREKRISAVANWLAIPAAQETLGTRMRRGGLRTGAAVSIWTIQARFGYGAGFDRYVDVLPDYYGPRSLTWLLRDTMGSQRRQRGAVTVGAAIDFLRDLDDGERFFLFLHLGDTHVPYTAWSSAIWSARSPDREAVERAWSSRYPDGRWPRARRAMSESGALLLDRYDTAIRYVDDQLGRLFAELEDRGRLDDTLILLTSDHGDSFGQHVYLSATQQRRLFFEHSVYVWEETQHVPFVVLAPDDPPGVRYRDVNVSHVDVAPTLLAGVGLAGSGRDGPGAPVGELAEGPRTVFYLTFGRGRPGLLTGVSFDFPKFVGFRRGGLKFFVDRERFRDPDAGRCFLYDLDRDPYELDDLCDQDEREAARMRELVVRWYTTSAAARVAGRER
jgi:arylsulfatase A-like enzyme